MTDESGALERTWAAPRQPLGDWVRSVGQAFHESGLTVEAAADTVAATQAEFESAIRLDTLEDDSLNLISEADPPTTTWMLLSQVPTEEITKALDGLKDRPRSTAFESVRTVLRELVGISPAERVTVLGAEAFHVAAKKADQYGVWPRSGRKAPKNVSALKSFATRRKGGRPLTPRQATYALGLLRQLVDRGVVAVPSPDGDDEICASIIAAVAEKPG